VARTIISEIPFLRSAIAVPYSHHERWDGGGYPQGLKAEAIPRIARIFTVADQWDALISNRPYREAMRIEDVTEYMRENAGRIYDPSAIDALMESLAEDAESWAGH
jgi:HD-GYP domain-containing protein (c-di-GMP phosphodiesterase class II)